MLRRCLSLGTGRYIAKESVFENDNYTSASLNIVLCDNLIAE